MENQKTCRLWGAIVVTLATMIAGCATVGDQRVDVLYQRSANASGGSGDLFVVEQAAPPTGGATTIQWLLGEIRNKDGEKLGNTVTDTAPVDTVTMAYVRELKGAGYNTVQQNTMPQGAAKGLVVRSASIKVDEVKSASSLEVKSTVTVSVEPWRDGRPVTKLDYEAEYTDTAVTGRDVLASKTLTKALQNLMKRSVPEIVKTIEQK